jgi:hypothetical protein
MKEKLDDDRDTNKDYYENWSIDTYRIKKAVSYTTITTQIRLSFFYHSNQHSYPVFIFQLHLTDRHWFKLQEKGERITYMRIILIHRK